METAYIIIGLIGFVFAITWLVLPFVLIGKLNEIVTALKSVDDKLMIQNFEMQKEKREKSIKDY